VDARLVWHELILEHRGRHGTAWKELRRDW
jgi:hypothetical protein